MLSNFWYPMAASDEIAEAPLRVEALGQAFALFRDEAGFVHCLADTCIHREFLDAWRGRGWEIDLERVAQTQARKLYAVPSPARRSQSGWIVDEVPRLPGD